MKHIRLLLAPLALCLSVSPVWADKLSLSEISAYLNDLKSAKAEFTQINDDGTISTGDISILRPGRIRFDYNPPDKSIVLASQGQVMVLDAKSNQSPDKFPLASTPLGLILARNVNLGQANMVVGHVSDGPTTTVIAQDPKHPEYGDIQLIFTGEPVQLRQWVIRDGAGQSTTVILGDLKTDVSFSARVFDMDEAMRKRGF